MENILFFTNNKNKLKEISKILKKNNVNILSKSEIHKIREPREIGNTFAENAKIKSLFGYNNFGIKCIADDSGICIEALKNRPGVNSKRFLNKFNNKNECFDYILKNVNKSGNYNAYFQTSICFTQKNNHHIVFEGKVRGVISKEIKGLGGFGYDPIFIPDGYNKTFAELSMAEKNKISHRSIAIKKFLSFIIN